VHVPDSRSAPATSTAAAADRLATAAREASAAVACVVAVYADIRAWKGRPGLSERAVRAVGALLEARPDALVALFAHPRLAGALAGRRMIAAWGGEPIMQEAVAAHILGGD
jgi:hypothetical protein